MPNIPIIKISEVEYDIKDSTAQKELSDMGATPSLRRFLYKYNAYKNASGVDVALPGYNLYKIKPNINDIIIIASSDIDHAFGKGLTATYWCGAMINGRYYPIADGADNYVGRLDTIYGEAIFIAYDTVTEIYVCVKQDFIDTTTVHINSYHADANKLGAVSADSVIKQATPDNSASVHALYANRDDNYFGRLGSPTENLRCLYYPVKAGTKIKTPSTPSAFSWIGVFRSFDRETRETLAYDYVAPKDGFVNSFYQVDEPNSTPKIYPSNAVRIEYSSIVDPPSDDNRKLLDNQNITMFGDSIVHQNNIQPLVAEKLGGVWTNCGIGSTALSGNSANAFWKDVRLNAVKSSNPEYLLILGGANDLTLNPVIGTDANLENKDTGTFIGAYSYIIDHLLTWKPSLKIIILSTTYAKNDGRDMSQTVTYGQFAAACKKVAEYYRLPYIDLYNESGFNQYTMGTGVNAVYADDKIHPNGLGASIIASFIVEKIRQIAIVS